ncbi:MAG: 5-(carboxyamino)imidazole ribonucleotide mutase [Bacteroidia bacterium]
MSKEKSLVGIIMGSANDLPIMQAAADILKKFNIAHEIDIVSAHRTPEKALAYSRDAVKNGLKVIIAGAGGAAHLAGVMAALTPLPIIGVPINSSNSLNGLDSLLSIVQMPSGVPVATVAINGAQNAGILAAQILATSDKALLKKIENYKQELKTKINASSEEIKRKIK